MTVRCRYHTLRRNRQFLISLPPVTVCLQRHVYVRLYWLPIVVSCDDMRADGLALFIEIALRRHAYLEAAIGRDDRVISRAFAVSFVLDTRLKAVPTIL